MRRILPIVTSMVFFAAPAIAQPGAARGATAKEEAIPALRDARVIVLRHVRVIDGTGSPAKGDQTMVIQDGKIRAVENDRELPLPSDATILDLSGRSVLPGLVMLHEHLFLNDPEPDATRLSHPEHFSFPRLYLAYGVTTLRTAGTDFPYMDLNLARR